MSNPGLAARLTSEARAMVERTFSAVVMVRQTEKMYREMMLIQRPDPVGAGLIAHRAK